MLIAARRRRIWLTPNSRGNKSKQFEIAFDLNEIVLCGMMRRRFARSLANFFKEG